VHGLQTVGFRSRAE